MRKVLHWRGSRAHMLIELIVPALRTFLKKGPYGFSMVQECARATLASADRTPLRSEQLPGWGEYSEWTHGDRSWCGGPHPSQLSFPTLHHWFPGWLTLVTLSFNLLQRAWPLEHVSRGCEQSLGYRSPNGNYRCPQLVLRKNFTVVTLLGWEVVVLCKRRSLKGGNIEKGVSKLQTEAGKGGSKWWGLEMSQILTLREVLAHHFLLDMDAGVMSVWALTHTALRNGQHPPGVVKVVWRSVSGAGTRGCVDTSLCLASEIKGHFEEVKINVRYQFQLLKNVTYFSVTRFN